MNTSLICTWYVCIGRDICKQTDCLGVPAGQLSRGRPKGPGTDAARCPALAALLAFVRPLRQSGEDGGTFFSGSRGVPPVLGIDTRIVTCTDACMYMCLCRYACIDIYMYTVFVCSVRLIHSFVCLHLFICASVLVFSWDFRCGSQ